MNIVTSIHAYNFHLFISYLGKGIRIFPFNDFRKSFYKTNAIYPREISHNKSLQEIITTKHILLGVNNSDISSFELNQNIHSKIDKSIINQFKANQLSLDYNYNDLYILTEEQGIVNLDFKNPYKSKILDKIIPKSFEELGEPIVSNMIQLCQI